MATVTIPVIAKTVAAKCGLSSVKAKKIIDLVIEEIQQAANQGDRVRLANLGTFVVKISEPRTFKVPQAPGQPLHAQAEVHVASRRRLRFHAFPHGGTS